MNIDDVQRELRKLAQLASLSEDLGDIIDSFALMSPDLAAKQAKQLLDYLGPLAQARAEEEGIEPDPFMPYPEPEEFVEGDVVLGELLGHEVRMPLNSLLTHMLIAGLTGGGKTTFVLDLLSQIIGLGVTVHVFDTEGEYADKLPGLSPAVSVMRFEDFRRNPFHGPDMSQQTWLHFMSDYMREAFYFRDGAINLFRDTAGRVLESGKPLNASTFAAQFHKTSLTTRRIQDYFETLKRFVYALELPPYQCAEGFDLAPLAQRSVVFDISQMPADLRGFFIADLVTWHSAARKYQRNRGIELVSVFDEMSKFVNIDAARRSDFGDPFILDVQFTRGRPYKKDDNAHIEQKNWTHVRKLVGYERYDTDAAVTALNTVYAELRLFQNLFLPTVKLVRKERVGARTRRRYDLPQTPVDRVRACPEADRAKVAALVALRDRLDPFVLATRVERLLERVYTLAHRRAVPGRGAHPVDGARPVDATSAPTRSLDARQKRGRPHRQPASSSTSPLVTGLMAR